MSGSEPTRPIRHIIQEGNEFQVALMRSLRTVFEDPMNTYMRDIHSLRAYKSNIENHSKLFEDYKWSLKRSIENIYQKKYGYNIETDYAAFEIINVNGYIDSWQIIIGIDSIYNFDQSRNPKKVYEKYIWMTIRFYALQPKSKKTRDITYLINKRGSI